VPFRSRSDPPRPRAHITARELTHFPGARGAPRDPVQPMRSSATPPEMGPLSGRKIVELAGIGPGPYCAMLLAELGADVVRVDRLGESNLGMPGKSAKFELMNRSRRSVAVDLKKREGVDAV